MANGDRILGTAGEFGIELKKFLALDGQTGAADGVWMVCMGAVAITLSVSGIGTGTVQLRGHQRSTLSTEPTDSDHHEQIGSDITANGQYAIPLEDVPDDFKIRKSAAGDSTSTTVVATVKYQRR